MAGRFSVEAVFRAIDKVSAPVRKMESRVQKFTRKARVGFRRLNAQVRKFSAGLRTAAIAGTAALLPLGFAVADVVRTGAQFEQTITNAAAKFELMDRNAEGVVEQLGAIEKAARHVGATTEFTATQAAEGLNFLAFAGFSAREAVAALPGMVDLATAAEIDLATATDIATDSLGAFGLASEDAVEQARNLTRIADVFAKATTSANLNMLQLMDTTADAAPVWTAAGQSLETFTAIAGILADAGIKGSKAGTQMKNMVTKIIKPSSEAGRVLANLGISAKDAATGGVRNMMDILEDLDLALAKKGFGVGAMERATAFATIFGVRAFAGAAVAIQKGVPAIRAYREELEAADGSARRMAAFMRDTLTGRMKEVVSSFESLKLSIFDLREGALNTLMRDLTNFIRRLDQTVSANEELTTTLIDGLGQAVLGAVQLFGLLFGAFVVGIAIIGAYKIVLAGLGVALLIFKGILLTTKAVMWLATAAMAAFNAVMAMNPGVLMVLAIVAAFAAVIAIIVLVRKHWDKIIAFVSRGIEFLAGIIKMIITPFANIFAGAKDLIGSAGALFDKQANVTLRQAEGDGVPAGVVSPQERTATQIEERRETSTAEVTIRAEAGAVAEVTGGKLGKDLQLALSGEF